MQRFEECVDGKEVEMNTYTTGFLQVFLAAFFVSFIQQTTFLGIVITSFLISLFWILNIDNDVFKGFKEWALYCISTSLGGITGYYFGVWA